MADTSQNLTDVIIAGGGFAGSLLALTLARQGHSVEVADLHRVYPPDFRCEKLGLDQAGLLAEMGALEPIARRAGLPGATPAEVARRGISYPDMVNGLRDAWPKTVRFREARVTGVQTSDDWQVAELSTGERLFGRLVVLATGRNERLRRSIGVERRTLRERHSLCIGFTLQAGEGRPPLPSLVAQGRVRDRVAFASLFPMNGATRVNLFCYQDADSDLARSFRRDPLAALKAAFPRLARKLEGARAVSAPEFGVIDLYRTEPHAGPGVVLIGDAFGSSCPATAMGLTRVLTDVRQLGLVHAPAWLKTPGMPAGKIAAFYADPLKRAVDRRSHRRAELSRFRATARGPAGAMFRLASRVRRTLAGRADRHVMPTYQAGAAA